ncbi:MAG: DUF1059 domain-containing protein [Acidobacteriaceae bacterium]|nr:DUF1059 domain-containing protein [Acidobacteriaceae bacterium]
MSKVLQCRDLGMQCDFQAHGETEQEVMQKAAEHAKSAHGIHEITPDLASQVKSAIHDE